MRHIAVLAAFAAALFAQQASTPSTLSIATKDGSRTVEIANTAYDVTGANIPGRAAKDQLVLRETARTKQVLDQPGMEAKLTVDAWLIGSDLKQKPLYSFTDEGTSVQRIENDLLVVSRGVEEVDWWTVHKLGTGARLFDTYVPLIKFSIKRDILTLRYAGLQRPTDDEKDARLKEPHVVAVITYASAEKILREALLTCDDPKQAVLYRSLADVTQTLVMSDLAQTLQMTIKQNYPSAANTLVITIPVANDALDLAHAVLPPRLHLAAWKR